MSEIIKNFQGKEGPELFCVVYQNFYPDRPNTQVLILEDGTKISSRQQIEDSYTFFDYYKQFYKGSFIDNFRIPHMIYTGIGSIRQFENMTLTQEEIDHLNRYGLYIFLYENLIFEIGEKKKFYIRENKTYRPITFHLQFELTPETFDSLYAFELESIDEFVTRNKLRAVRVLTCEHKSRKFFKDKYKNFTVGSKDIFLTSLFQEVHWAPNSYQHNPSLINRFNSSTIKYKFWSTNWRYDVHRHFTVLYLADKSALFSWAYKNSIHEVKERFWFDLDRWRSYPIYKTLMYNDRCIVENGEPFVIDWPVKKLTEVRVGQIYTTPECEEGDPNARAIPMDMMEQCFCAVVTESAFAHPLANFTEKTLAVIKTMRPFVLVAPPGTLEYLQNLGFKTFGRFWDETYDAEVNHEKRLLKIFETLDYINSKSVDELKDLYDKLLPILRHNYTVLNSFKHNGRIND